MKKIFILLTFILFFENAFAQRQKIEIKLNDKDTLNLWYDIYKADKLPAPTIIVLHGCGGVDEHHKGWAELIQSWGYNAIILDSFTGVATQKVCDNFKQEFTRPNVRATSALHLAEHISNQEWSTKKLGAIGYSHGGWTVLWLSNKEHRSNFQNPKIVSAVAYYPYCESVLKYTKRDIDIEIHHGSIDDWTPLSLCLDLAKNWKLLLGKNLHVYQDAHHGFDRKNYNWSGNSASGFVTVKTNEEARQLSMKRTKEFFDRTLR
jgi:dienelactone hydrolase